MPLTPTTPHAIRDALVPYIEQMTPTELPGSRWAYEKDIEAPTGGIRRFTLVVEPSSQEFAGPYGSGGVAAGFDLEINVKYLGLSQTQVERAANGDRRDLEKLIHPLPQHGAQGIAGLLPIRDPVTFDQDGREATFVIAVRYWEAS